MEVMCRLWYGIYRTKSPSARHDTTRRTEWMDGWMDGSTQAQSFLSVVCCVSHIYICNNKRGQTPTKSQCLRERERVAHVCRLSYHGGGGSTAA